MFDVLKACGQSRVAICGMTVLLAGCGIKEYNSLVDQGITTLRASARFQHLYAPSALPDSPVSVRIPMVFANSYQATSSHKDDGAVINPDRLQPPFLKLPGLKLCYEGMNSASGPTIPFYCYLAAMPASPGEADKLAEQIQAQLKKAFPESEAEWEGVDAETPQGKYIHWRKIRVNGEQPFLVKVNDKIETQGLVGTFELWLHDADNQIAMIGWRAPDSVQGASSTESAVEAVAKAISGPPKDAKLDLEDLPTATAGTLEISRGDAG